MSRKHLIQNPTTRYITAAILAVISVVLFWVSRPAFHKN